jgi:CDP-diacylglycerol--serine O-phosphatidyltransferase
VRRVSLLPNILTLGNAFCGLLALAKAIDALAFAAGNAAMFYDKLETACWLVFAGMLFDAVDGKVARMTGGASEFGAQLDSFSDALTFGCVPPLLAKVLIEHDGPLHGYAGNPRLHFLAAAAFALMAILRLARFNLENEPEEKAHQSFKGLPSPAAAGAVVSMILLYLTMRRPELQVDEGRPTPLGRLLEVVPLFQHVDLPAWYLPGLAIALPLVGFLMVSRVPYAHVASRLSKRGSFFALVWVVFAAFVLFAAPVPALFLAFNGFLAWGVVRWIFTRRKRTSLPLPDDSFTGSLR